MKCPRCGESVRVSLEEAAKILGTAGGKRRGVGKRRVLSRERAIEMVRAKVAKRAGEGRVEDEWAGMEIPREGD